MSRKRGTAFFNNLVCNQLSLNGVLAPSNLPPIPLSAIVGTDGLAAIAVSGHASNLLGVLDASNLPPIPLSSITGIGGLATIATSGAASNLIGVLSTSNLPIIPASQLSGLSAISVSGQASNLGGVLAISNLPIIPASQLSGLSAIAISGQASNLDGVLTVSNLPTIPASQLSGLAAISVSGQASNLSGVLTSSNVPSLDATKIAFGDFIVGSFATSLVPVTSNTYDVGNASHNWRSAFLSSNLSAASVTAPSITSSNGSFAGNLSVLGDLTIGGVLQNVTTNDLLVSHKHATLAYSSTPTDSGASGAGLYVCGSDYATSHSRLSLTWNSGCNGDSWSISGGNLALTSTTSGSNVVLGNENGSLSLTLDNGIDPTSTPTLASSLIPSTSNTSVGGSNNYWGSVYTSSLRADSVTVGATNPITSYRDWAPWTPATSTPNVTMLVNMARYCTINKRCTIHYDVQLTIAAATSQVVLSLPINVATKTAVAQPYVKSAGSNTYVNTNFTLNTMTTFGTCQGTAQADDVTDSLFLNLNNFIPGLWTAIGQLTYETM